MLAALDGAAVWFADRLILKDVSAAVEDADRIGLVGPNGIGKSTLLHLLTGRLAPDEGTISLTNGVRVGILEQNCGQSGTGSIREEMRSVFAELLAAEQTLRSLEARMAAIPTGDPAGGEDGLEYSRLSAWFESRGGYQIDVKIKTVLNGMGFADTSDELPVAALSGGEKTRLALAKLLLEEPDLLLLDEPTNHLDFRTLAWLEDYLSGWKGGLLAVSHDRYFLDKVVSKIWEIENKTVVAYPGNYSKYKQLRAERYRRLEKEYEAQRQKIDAMRDYAQRNIVRATTSNMAKSRLHQLSHIEPLEKPRDVTPTPRFHFRFRQNPVKDLLAVRDLTLAVGAGAERKLLSRGISFDIKRGEKVALIGPNGAGKSTLLKTLLGLLPAEGGIYWGDKAQCGYYEQENLTLHREKTALEELWDRFPRLAPYEARGILGQVLITGDDAFKPVGVLSGGERARVALAVLMTEHANVLLLDEPTNHLDLPSKEELEKALVEFPGTLLFVSHDRYFLNAIPARILELRPDGLAIYEGNFDAYLEAKRQSADKPPPPPPKPVSEGARAAYRSRQERAAEAKRKSRVRELESAIETAEAHIAALEAELASPAAAADYERLGELCAKIEEARARHEADFAEWAELSGE